MGDSEQLILMLKNHAVYNTTTQQVYNRNRLPGLMYKNPCLDTFKMWFKLRYSSNTNTSARKLKGITFGQGNRIMIDRITRAFSLSDCYWIKELQEDIYFEQCSPYFTDFWKGCNSYNGMSVPTLYVSGYLSKEWISSTVLAKYGKQTLIEVECSKLCYDCGIQVAPVLKIEDKDGVVVGNITTPSIMLEQADQSGVFNEDTYTDIDIIKVFGVRGVQMLTIDAIVGNGDRHLGNFGWIRDVNTGAYIQMAPLYDFDHALDSTETKDALIKSLVLVIKDMEFTDGRDEVLRICSKCLEVSSNSIFRKRATSITKIIKEV